MRYLMNNTQMIEKMANSYPIRRAAQLTVYLFHRSKAALEDKRAIEFKNKITEQMKLTGENPTEKLKSLHTKFQQEFRKEWEKVRGGGPLKK